MKTTFITIGPEITPLGALNVSTYLRQNGYKSSLLYLIAPYSKPLAPKAQENIISFLEETRPDVLGFSVFTIFSKVARELSVEIRKKFPSLLIVWGGIHPTIKPEECLEYCDIVCRGESEEAMLNLVSHLDRGEDYHHLENLSVHKNGSIHQNEITPLRQDLDKRPFPVFDWDNTFVIHTKSVEPLTKDTINRYRPKNGTIYEVMPSRGCPFRCTFCCNSTFNNLYRGKGKILRYRSAEHVMSELEYAVKEFPAIEGINFEDDALGAAPERYLDEFCRLYKEQIGLPFQIRILPTHNVKEKKLRMLRDAGLVGAVMGLQGSDKMNKEVYKRPTSQKSFIEVAKMLHRNKIIGKYDLIIDNPYSDENDEIEAIRTFMEVPKPYFLRTFSLAFFPHTELTARAMEDGTFDKSTSGSEHIYGNYDQHLFPSLARLAEMVPFTPRFIIAFFLFCRKSRIGRLSLWIYRHSIFALQRKLLDYFLERPKYLLFLKKYLYRAKHNVPVKV